MCLNVPLYKQMQTICRLVYSQAETRLTRPQRSTDATSCLTEPWRNLPRGFHGVAALG